MILNREMESPSSSETTRSFSRSISDIGASQSLSSILNNPHHIDAANSSSWIVGWWSASAVSVPELSSSSVAAAKAASAAADLVTRSTLEPYLSSISDPYNRFQDVRNHTTTNEIQTTAQQQGDSLVACLREVPAFFFKEDFALEDGATFRAACPLFENHLLLQEKLSHYLDVVELHLVREISLRSNSFFEAQGQLEDLNLRIVQGCTQIRDLKQTITLLDTDLVGSATRIQDVNMTRENLLLLQHKLRIILYVNQALSALKLLVASADCAGALDVTDDLQHLLNGDELAGLHCFRHLNDHVTTSIESINSVLSAEFMRASIHDTGDMDLMIISKAKSRISIATNGKADAVLDEEKTSNFQDHLLPLIIGLLRTAKLPSVLRIYRDTLTADMKASIKMAVAELLPVLVGRPMESDFSPLERTSDADGGGLSLASKMRSLSSDSFVVLLSVIFQIVRAHLVRAAEVKKAIEWIMSNLDGHYAADSVAAAIALGAAASADISPESDDRFNSLLPSAAQKNAFKVPPFQGKGHDAGTSSNMSRNFRADVLRENTEAVFAACDAAQGRWAKLLGVRALLHPKLRLQEFLTIYNITQEFIASTEKIGGRLGFSIRGTLHSQAKAFVEFQHESRMAKIKAVLDQETWVEVDVPDEFQIIITSLFFSEPVNTGNQISDGNTKTSNDVLMVDSGKPNMHQQIERTDSIETSAEVNAEASSKSTEKNSNIREHGKITSQTLLFGGAGYHMVNCGLILLKMLSEYIDMNSFLPALSSEVVHRAVQILKFFNTRTCQLVLGAGAMQVSGLKSITAKHLALASQVISFTYSIIPDIRRILLLKVPEERKLLLLSEIDRVAQDYKVHRDEIHTKLVQIMRERLLVHLRGLPQIVESWNRPEDNDSQPSQFARSLTKEVGYLQRVLSRTLHDVDVHDIFRQVVVIFHSQISEAFSHLEISTPQAKNRLGRDVQHILGCIRSLPTNSLSESGTPNLGKLDDFLAQRFGSDAGQ